MKITVDMSVCERYGHCCFEAPEVFQLDDDGELLHLTEADDALGPQVEAAARNCPVLAITTAAE
ncbi:ferredoxin [Nocardioides okcheonensis]|uniref:ferredoxin n=1 Tax=Nocardioides okcheonensis TaxID=2894081 RepID=UPI001E50B2F4|nr:ferredoxin [Nocardioides okcheonensis]UFN45173.1 ferredoxin [Nocardioides okcheonensis]